MKDKLKRLRGHWLGILAVALALAMVATAFPVHVTRDISSIGEVGILTVGQGQYHITIGTPVSATTADYTCDGIDDDVQFQAALDALPASGGQLLVLTGDFDFENGTTVTRAIDDVSIIGVGASVSFTCDATTAIFTAGGNNWLFSNFETDAGGLDMGATTDWMWLNLTLGGTYYALDTEDDPAVDTSGTPVDDDYAKFTDADTVEGRSYAEVRTDLGLVPDTDVPAQASFDDHSARHENAGADEISVAGLSGLLADDQHVLDAEVQAIKLDDFATPDDNTDLDASLTEHGLLLKLGGGTTNFLRADGTWAAPAGGGDVTGPSSSTDNAIARFDGTTGKIIQDYTSGPPTISDTGDLTLGGDIDAQGHKIHDQVSPYAAKTSHYTTTVDDEIIVVDTTLGVVTITLGSATVRAGQLVLVKDYGYSGTNAITIATEGAELIDSASTDTINRNYFSKQYYSNGTNWYSYSLTDDNDVYGLMEKGDYSGLPGAGIAGRVYFASDTKQLLRDTGSGWQEILRGEPYETELTISTGAITITQLRHKIDTESDDATDDLVTINGAYGNVHLIILRAENDARTVVVKHNTGNIWLRGKSDLSLDDLEDGIMLAWDSTNSKWFSVAAGGGVGGGVDTSGTPVTNDYARFTDADTIEGRSYAEVQADLSLEIGTDVLAEQTIGIADDNLMEVDDADAADDDYAKFTANGLEGRSYAEVRTDLGLVIGTNVQAYDAELTIIAGLSIADGNLMVGNGSTWVVESGATVRTSLGLGTGDSPQFTAVNVGAAADTTLARSSAGHVSVEGDVLLGESDVDDTPSDGDTSDPISSNWAYDHDADGSAHQSNVITITFVINGGGSAISTGEWGHLEIPFACTITQATLAADQSGSIVIDIWKDTYANFPPTDGDSITASAPPTISAAQKSQDSTLSGWTTSVSAGDILAFNVDSCATIEIITLSIRATKT